ARRAARAPRPRAVRARTTQIRGDGPRGRAPAGRRTMRVAVGIFARSPAISAAVPKFLAKRYRLRAFRSLRVPDAELLPTCSLRAVRKIARITFMGLGGRTGLPATPAHGRSHGHRVEGKAGFNRPHADAALSPRRRRHGICRPGHPGWPPAWARAEESTAAPRRPPSRARMP